MSSLLFGTKWRRIQLRGSRNFQFLLMIVIVFISCTDFCRGDSEPKANDDDSTAVAKAFGENRNPLPFDRHDDVGFGAVDAANGGAAPKPNLNEDGGSSSSSKSSIPLSNLGFIHAFVASISVILVSELGDKTFFIAAIMAMRHPRITIFVGAISALAFMTILSAVFGMAAQIIPRVYTYYISTFLFAVFGLKMLKEGYYMKPSDAQEELEEVQSDLRKREDELMKTLKDGAGSKPTSTSPDDLRNTSASTTRKHHRIKDDYDSDDDDGNDQIRAMLPSGSTVSISAATNHDNKTTKLLMNGVGQSNIVDRRTQSALNLNLVDGATVIKTNNNRYSMEIGGTNHINEGIVMNLSQSNAGCSGGGGVLMKTSTSLSGKQLNKGGDINSNGVVMELKQFGSKNSLEKETSAQSLQDPESGIIRRAKPRSAAYITSRIFMQAFTMTFLAEWGDRSQLTTIILSAREDIYGVIVGGVLGHSICTGLAVIGGRMIAQRISVRTVTLVGGVVFILFAISALFFNPNEE